MSKETSSVEAEESLTQITLAQQALASCTGAIITSLFVTPLDVVKIRMQVQQKNTGKCFLYCNGLMDHLCDCSAENGSKQWYQRPGHFSGTIDAFIKISRTEGISSLWSGLSPTLVLALPATVVYFVTYEQLRMRLKERYNRSNVGNEVSKQPLWIPLISGASARIISASTVSPLELIRTKMQSRRLTYLEIGAALNILIKQDGFRGLWKGVIPTLLRDVPFSAVYWMSYEMIKSTCSTEVPSFWYSFMAGAVSGSIAATITTPFDVVKTHQQIEFGEQMSGQGNKVPTITALMKTIYSKQGLRGLFAGLAPRIVKVAPACAIMIATFEHGKVFFNRLANAKLYNSKSSESDDTNVSKISHPNYNSSLSLQPKETLVRDLKRDVL